MEKKEFYTQVQRFSITIQNMPHCAESLRMLADEQRDIAKQINDTIDSISGKLSKK